MKVIIEAIILGIFVMIGLLLGGMSIGSCIESVAVEMTAWRNDGIGHHVNCGIEKIAEEMKINRENEIVRRNIET
jgi:hypothetical protein